MSTVSHPPTPSWRRSVWVVFVTVVTVLLLKIVCDQSLLSESVKRELSKSYAPTLSLFYPQTGQKKITVLTIDDLDLKEYGLNWPVPLDYYQRLIDHLLKHQPKAIFLDVLFLDDKPQRELDSLADAACRAKKVGVPFFLATFSNAPLADSAETTLLGKQDKDGKHCVIPVLSNISPDEMDQTQWSYPLVFESEQVKTQREKQQLQLTCSSESASVALTIYRRLFKPECPADVGTPLALIWGSKAATTNAQTMVYRPSPGAPLVPVCGNALHGWELIPVVKMAVELVVRDRPLPLCPYHQVLPVRSLKGHGFSPEELHEAVSGKIIMIGGNLKAVGDNIFSPVHGPLPGVHVHAMALDNLISFNGQYKQSGYFNSTRPTHSKANQFLLFSVCLISIVVVLWREYKTKKIATSQKSDELKQLHPRDANLVLNCAERQEKNFSKNMSNASNGWVSRLLLTFLLPIFWVLGFPGYLMTGFQRYKLQLIAMQSILFLVTGLLILYIGYVCYDQGPLVIVEYGFFFTAVQGFNLGEKVVKHISQSRLALQGDEPWLVWAHLNKDAEKRKDR